MNAYMIVPVEGGVQFTPFCLEGTSESVSDEGRKLLGPEPTFVQHPIPYPAHPNRSAKPSGCPSFCYGKKECFGKSACPRAYSCTE